MATNLSSPFAQIRSQVLEVVLLRLRHCGNAGRDRARGGCNSVQAVPFARENRALVRGLWVRCHRSAPEGAVRLLAWLAGITGFVFFCFGVVTKSSSSATAEAQRCRPSHTCFCALLILEGGFALVKHAWPP